MQKVRSAGVVGAGGAGFPTHVKLAAKADTVLANGAECEPLLEVDLNLLTHHLDEVLEGLKATKEVVGASRAILAIKAKHSGLMTKLEAAAARLPWLDIVGLPDLYPIGDEHLLVHRVLGKTVPPGGIPLDVGVVVLNIETLLNVSRALQGKAVTTSYMTVAGAVSAPSTMAVPIGTSMEDVLALAGPLLKKGEFALVEGGPLMGRLVDDPREPVTKTTKGLIILPRGQGVVARLQARSTMLRRSFSVCSQCTMCTDLCPRHVLGHPIWPHKIMRALIGVGGTRWADMSRQHNSDILQGALFCSECGVCDEYACFMGLSPRFVNQELKELYRKQAREVPTINPALHPLPESREDSGQDDGSRSDSSWEGDRRIDSSLVHSSLGSSPGDSNRENGQVPTSRLLYRLRLAEWQKPAPYMEHFPAPAKVEIKLKQHIGSSAYPLVQVGDVVAKGDLIAEVPQGQRGALVHSSMDGVVESVTDSAIVIRRWECHG